MSKLTKDQWATLESSYGLFSPVNLMCDGFKVSLCKSEGKNKMLHAVYVNGWSKGEWLKKESEHPESKFMYTQNYTVRTNNEAELKKLRRLFGKEKAKVFEPKKLSFLTPFFPSFATFKRHLIAVCDNIELIPKTHEND